MNKIMMNKACLCLSSFFVGTLLSISVFQLFDFVNFSLYVNNILTSLLFLFPLVFIFLVLSYVFLFFFKFSVRSTVYNVTFYLFLSLVSFIISPIGSGGQIYFFIVVSISCLSSSVILALLNLKRNNGNSVSQ